MHAKVLHKMAPVFLALLLSFSVICIGIEEFVAITEVDVVTSSPWASLGSYYFTIWKTHQALELCQIALGNEDYRSLYPKNDTGLRAENVRYHGRGLNTGDCGFMIRNITKDHHVPVHFRAYRVSEDHTTPPILLLRHINVDEEFAAITEVDVVRSSPWAYLGSNYSIIWKTHQALVLCQIALGNEDYRILFPKSHIAVRAENIEYHGRGLSTGDCGFTIRNVTEDHHVPVHFRTYLVHEALPIVLAKHINVVLPPKGKPHLWFEGDSDQFASYVYRDGDTLNAWCEVEGGRPEPVFEWYLNKRLITKGIKQQVSNADSPNVKYTQNLRLAVNWTQNAMFFSCNVSHTWKKDKDSAFKILYVRYSPREMKGPIHLEGFVTGESANISVDVQAYPGPQFTWTVDDVIVQETMAVEQKLLVWPGQLVATDTWRAILTVMNLNDADLNRNYSLRATNEEGQAIYNVKIFGTRRTTSTDFEPTPGTVTKMTPNDTDALDGQRDETGLGWAAITGIMVAILLLLMLVLVLLLVGYGWTTGRWCFVVKSETNTHDDVVLGEQFELRQLGLIWKGKVCLPGEVAPLEVLVKPVVLTHTRTLASEMQVWCNLLPHVNVLRLLGTYTSNLNKDDLLVVVEFCRHGNLHDYLLRRRSDFIDQVNRLTERIDPRIGAVIFANFREREKLKRSQNVCTNNTGPDHFYESIEQLYSRSATDYSEQHPLIGTRDRDRDPPVCTGDLLSWVFQVAQGMDYLADRKIVHGNLAARHVFLADDNIVKISDSRLSRSVSETSEFLPLKWMAVESLKDGTVSLESDVWSYGIFMWEVFSLAQTPYPDIESREKLYDILLRGYRLDKPQFGIQAIYDVMMLCWQLKPKDRPPFHQVISHVGKVFENSFEDMYMNVSHLYEVITNPTESESHQYYEVAPHGAIATRGTATKMEDEKLDRESCQYYEIGSGAINMNDSGVQ